MRGAVTFFTAFAVLVLVPTFAEEVLDRAQTWLSAYFGGLSGVIVAFLLIVGAGFTGWGAELALEWVERRRSRKGR